MKKTTAKYVCLIALMLAVSVSTASAQQQQNTRLQTRQPLRDQSSIATPQQQRQFCGQNKTRRENNLGQGQSRGQGQKGRHGNRKGHGKCAIPISP